MALNLSSSKPKNILDRPLSKGKGEVSAAVYALLFSEMVQYSQSKASSIQELHQRLHKMGYDVGHRVTELYCVRERNSKRETKISNILIFIKSQIWKNLFGKEADKVEHANDDEKVYYLIENEPLVNKYISIPKDKASLNCAAFNAGIIQAILYFSDFPCEVSAHWHKGTTYMIKFEEDVIARDKLLEDK